MSRQRDEIEDLVETERFVLFWKPPAVFSQWTLAAFEVDGARYTSAEQFMMAEKARLFGDEVTRAKILATTSPRQQKRLGRQVEGFDDVVWTRERVGIVVRGNLAKFGQDPALRRALLATGDKVLVEASPFDRIWGIGRRPTDPKALVPAEWRGLNLLGKALERVRDELRAGSAGQRA